MLKSKTRPLLIICIAFAGASSYLTMAIEEIPKDIKKLKNDKEK